MTERLGVAAENLHEHIVREIAELGERRRKGNTEYVRFGNCMVVVKGSTAVTFIRGGR
jgi:hypothetical protein